MNLNISFFTSLSNGNTLGSREFFSYFTMRGYLRSPGHNYTLDAEVTSIGKGSGVNGQPVDGYKLVGAHIPLDSGRVERMHAVVERRTDDNCYILQDLNSAYGTYVNEHRVQNGAVKLTPGDVIRFGHGGVPHEFDLTTDKDNRMTKSKPHSAGPRSGAKSAVETGTFEKQARNTSGYGRHSPLQYDNIAFRPDTAPTSPKNATPPLSQLILSERSKSVPLNLKMNSSSSRGSISPRNKTPETSYTAELRQHTAQNGWATIGSRDGIEVTEKETTYSKEDVNEKETTSVEPWYVAMLREKEQRLLHMGDEISRLGVIESENRRKDSVINELRFKMAELEENLLELKSNTNVAEKERKLLQMGDEINRLAVYESECGRKDKLVAALRDQVGALEVDKQALTAELENSQKRLSIRTDITIDATSMATEDLSDETGKIKSKLGSLDGSLLSAQDELDEFRKQLNLPIPDRRPAEEIVLELKVEMEEKDDLIAKLQDKLINAEQELRLSHGLVENLQNDVNRREHKMMKLSSAYEKSQMDCQEANDQVQAMSHKFANLKEEKKHEEIVAMMEKELNEVKSELKMTQQRVIKQQEKLEKQGKELKREKRQNKQYLESGKLMQQQIDEMTAELTEIRKSDQEVKVENEQNQTKLERLRSRIVQAVYTAPGAVRPESMLQDTEILTAMQKIIDDRSEFHQQLSDLGQNVTPLVVTLEAPVEEEPPSPGNDPISNQAERKSNKGGKKSGKK